MRRQAIDFIAPPAADQAERPIAVERKSDGRGHEPEIDADAPTIHTFTGMGRRCKAAPAAAVTAKNAMKRQAPNRRATGVPKASSHIELKPRCMQSA